MVLKALGYVRQRLSYFVSEYYGGRQPGAYTLIFWGGFAPAIAMLHYAYGEHFTKDIKHKPKLPELQLYKHCETMTFVTNKRGTSILLARDYNPPFHWIGFHNKVEETDDLRKVAAMGVFKHVAVPLQDLQEVGVITIQKAGEPDHETRVFVATTVEGPIPQKEKGYQFRWCKYPYDLPMENMESHISFWLDHAVRAEHFTFRARLDKESNVINHSLKQVSGVEKDQKFRRDPDWVKPVIEPTTDWRRKSRWDDGIILKDLMGVPDLEVYHSKPGLPPKSDKQQIMGFVYRKVPLD